MSGTIYIIDSNVLIEAARRYYAFDLAPGFWQSLIDHSGTGAICSIDRVKQELVQGKDQLAAWVKKDFVHAFRSTADEPDVVDAYRDVIEWVQSQPQFFDEAKSAFADVADGWLVAFARAKGCVVVTHEEYRPDIRRNVPIPNVCRAFNVPFVDTFQMLRNLGVRWAR